MFFKLTVSRLNFYWQIQLQSFHTAWAHHDRPPFFGPTVANGALRTWLDLKATLEAANLDVIADRGYFSGEEILECDKAGITVTLPKPMTSNSKAEGRFGKQDFR